MRHGYTSFQDLINLTGVPIKAASVTNTDTDQVHHHFPAKAGASLARIKALQNRRGKPVFVCYSTVSCWLIKRWMLARKIQGIFLFVGEIGKCGN